MNVAKWVILVLVVPSAAAASGARILLIPQGAHAEAREQVAASFARELKVEHDVSVLVAAGGGDELTRDVTTLLEKVKVASQSFKEKRALELLDEAEREIQARCAGLSSAQPLIDVLLARAKLLMDLGKERDAKDTLRRVVALGPKTQLDPGIFPPAMQRAHKALQEEQRRAPRATISLTSVPEGLSAYVDSVPMGKTPLQVAVSPGPHLVAVGEPGSSRASLIDVGAGGRRELTFAVARMARDDQALRAVARIRAAKWAVTLRVEGEGPAQRIRLRLVPVSAEGLPRRLSSDQRGAAGIEALAAKAAALIAGRRVATGGNENGSILRRWWFWTIVGAVAAGAGATAGVLLTRDDPVVKLRLVP